MPQRATAEKPEKRSVVLLSDGRVGHLRQMQALAHALNMQAEIHEFRMLAPWRWMALRWPTFAHVSLDQESRSLLDSPPERVIACGRRAAGFSRLLRERGSEVVQILNPGVEPRLWNLLVVPAHDGLSGANVISLTGSLNRIDDEWLEQGRVQFPAIGRLASPRIAVILGGPSKHARFNRGAFEVMAARIEYWLAQSGGSILLSTSARTPDAIREILRYRYNETPGVIFLNDKDRSNPYAGILSWADCIVCSPDSVNMISEACASTVPVYVSEPQRARGRLRIFLDSMLASGRIQTMPRDLKLSEQEPMRETQRVAELVKQRMGW